MISVSGPRITGRESLITPAMTLSGPGDLFKGILKIMRHTSPQVTGFKLNSSSEAGMWESKGGSDKVILFSSAKQAAACAAFLPTEEKNTLKSSATTFRFLVYEYRVLCFWWNETINDFPQWALVMFVFLCFFESIFYIRVSQQSLTVLRDSL